MRPGQLVRTLSAHHHRLDQIPRSPHPDTSHRKGPGCPETWDDCSVRYVVNSDTSRPANSTLSLNSNTNAPWFPALPPFLPSSGRLSTQRQVILCVHLAEKRTDAVARQVEDFLVWCRGRGLSPKTWRDAYGYPLRAVLVPYCQREGIADLGDLNRQGVDRLAAELYQREPPLSQRP
jgi:hypothetical protein